jgi:hypothetical protein
MARLSKSESLGARFQPTPLLKKMAAEGRGSTRRANAGERRSDVCA